MAEGPVVIGYDVAALGNPIATFRENIVASYSEVKISKNNDWILKCVAITSANNKRVPY